MGALLSFSRTSTFRRCSGCRTTATLKRDDAPSCGVSSAVPAKLTDHHATPSCAGAVSSSSAQCSALVPGHGVAPRLPPATTVPAGSLTSIGLPASAQPLEDLAPTLIRNFSPMTTGEGTA